MSFALASNSEQVQIIVEARKGMPCSQTGLVLEEVSIVSLH